MEKIFILDSTAFLEGGAGEFQDKATATVYEVLEEIKNGKSAIELDRMIRMGMAVIEPKDESIKEITGIQEKTNDKLSKTDTKVLALACQFKKNGKTPVLVSDDYAMQNICKNLDIEFLPMSKKGITKKFRWIKICDNCGRKIKNDVCDVCGGTAKFRPTA